jgi:hypothetical protein
MTPKSVRTGENIIIITPKKIQSIFFWEGEKQFPREI